MKGDPIVIAQVTVMSNEMIRTALKEFGNDPGPIVGKVVVNSSIASWLLINQ